MSQFRRHWTAVIRAADVGCCTRSPVRVYKRQGHRRPFAGEIAQESRSMEPVVPSRAQVPTGMRIVAKADVQSRSSRGPATKLDVSTDFVLEKFCNVSSSNPARDRGLHSRAARRHRSEERRVGKEWRSL